jgi:hypothetical protein
MDIGGIKDEHWSTWRDRRKFASGRALYEMQMSGNTVISG